jgi:ABC-type lipoprotein release transport system permease subunit
MHLRMAWRNIWRNPRRTGVILAAVGIGVWSNLSLGALSRGMVADMVRNGISTLTGHIQVHALGYRDDPVIEHSLEEPAAVAAVLRRVLPSGSHWTSRIRVAAVASNARHSGGVSLVGIDPAAEAEVSFIGRSMREGRYLRSDDPNAIVVGRSLLDKFETRPGHRLVLMSQATDGQIASASFRIVGVYRAELEATEERYVFVTREAARRMLGMGEAVSEFSILLPDTEMVAGVAGRLRAELPAGCEVSTWQEMLPLLDAYVGIFDGFMLLWYVVVFIAMGFGIVNTTLMAVYERMQEFGLMKALGMRPSGIVRDVLAESSFLLLLGVVLGNAAGLATVALLTWTGIDLSALAAGSEYFGMSRVIRPELAGGDFLLANLVVVGLGLLVSLYPAVKAGRFTPVEALTRT